MTPKFKFELGQTPIYHATKSEFVGQITGRLERIGGGKLYAVTWSDDLCEKWHYEIELTEEKDYANP